MSDTKAYIEYTEQSLYTASPGELLVMLFNAEIKNIKSAMLYIEAKNITRSHEKLMKAQGIMTELISSLDNSYEIAKELTPLYNFIKKELIAANLSKDAAKLEEILPVVISLRDTWENANQITRDNTIISKQGSNYDG